MRINDSLLFRPSGQSPTSPSRKKRSPMKDPSHYEDANVAPTILFAPKKVRHREPELSEVPGSPLVGEKNAATALFDEHTAKEVKPGGPSAAGAQATTTTAPAAPTKPQQSTNSPQKPKDKKRRASITNIAPVLANLLRSASEPVISIPPPLPPPEKPIKDSTTVFYHLLHAKNESLHRNELQQITFEILSEAPTIRIEIYNKELLNWIGMHFGIKIKKRFIPVNERHPYATLSLSVDEQKELTAMNPDRIMETVLLYESSSDLYPNTKETVQVPMQYHMVFPLHLLVELDSKVMFLKPLNYEIQVYEELHICKRLSSLNLREFTYKFNDVGLYKVRIHSKSILHFSVSVTGGEGQLFEEREYSMTRDLDNDFNGEFGTVYAFLLPQYLPIFDMHSEITIRFHNSHQLSYNLQIAKLPHSKAHLRKCIVLTNIFEQLQQAMSKADADHIRYWIHTISGQEYWKFRSKYLKVDLQSLVIVATQMLNELDKKLEQAEALYRERHQYSVAELSEHLNSMRTFYLSSHELASYVDRFTRYVELRESFDSLKQAMRTVLKNKKKYLQPMYYKQLRKNYQQIMELCGHFLREESSMDKSSVTNSSTALDSSTQSTMTESAGQETPTTSTVTTERTNDPDASEHESSAVTTTLPSTPSAPDSHDTSTTTNTSLSSSQISADSLSELFNSDLKELIVEFRQFLSKLSKQQKLLHTLQKIMQSKNMPQLAQFLREFDDILPADQSMEAKNTLYHWIKAQRASKRAAKMIAQGKQDEQSLDSSSEKESPKSEKTLQPIHFAHKSNHLPLDYTNLESNEMEFISVSRESLRAGSSSAREHAQVDPSQEVMRLHKTSKQLADLAGEHYVNNRLTVFNEHPFVGDLTTLVEILGAMLLNNRQVFAGSVILSPFVTDKTPQPKPVMQIIKSSCPQGKNLVKRVRKYQNAHCEYHHITEEAQREECEVDLLVVYGLHHGLLLTLLILLMTEKRSHLQKYYTPKSLLLQRRTREDLLCILQMLCNVEFVFDFLGFDKTSISPR